MMIASVVVDVPASGTDHPFDYHVPEVFETWIEKGMRVIVPFGPRKIQGFISALQNGVESDRQLKAISKVIDVEPVLDEELLELGFWLAETTLCFTISAFQAMLPAALKASYKKEILPHPQAEETLLGEVASLFAGKKTVYWETLTKEQPHLLASVRSYIQAGTLQVIQHVQHRAPRKVEKVVYPAVSTKELNEAYHNLTGQATRQKQLLAFFIDHPQSITIKTLISRLETSRDSVKSLVKKNLLHEGEQEVYRDPYADYKQSNTVPLPLTGEQKTAMDLIREAMQKESRETILLHGVTGSGKTEVYLQAIEHVLNDGKEAIVLVPEIALTPQMVERFKGRFGSDVAVMHSGLSRGEKYDEWRKVQNGEVNVVVGARSAIFAPFTRLGLIILDEEHETSYKQEEQPRYHARDVAIHRACRHRCPVLLGSATPSLESYARAQKGIYQLATLQERINQQAMPAVEIVDMSAELRDGNRSMFSAELYEKLKERLRKGEQSVLLLNRRGYSTFMICRECGYVAQCPHCDISLTYHKKNQRLKCHYCGYEETLPQACPSCDSAYIRFFGTGTQKVEEELGKVLPEASVIRMDVDTTSRKGMHEVHLRRFGEGNADILLGTQMIAKGLDFPNVTLVGVLAADSMLHLPDFRASERTFQLLTQVSGRAGRHELTGEVVVQTYSPEHYSIQLVAGHDYMTFYKQEMQERHAHHYPPYFFLALVTITDSDLMKVAQVAEKMAAALKNHLTEQAVVLGPVAAAVPRIKDRYRYQCMVKYRHEPELREWLTRLVNHHTDRSGDLKMMVDMDPQMLM